jgi:O-antigen ligase
MIMPQTEVGRLRPDPVGSVFKAGAFDLHRELWSPRSRSALLVVGIAIMAAMIGVAIAKGNWIYLLPVAFIVGVMFWPVAMALGSFALLLPFENASAISGSVRRFSVPTVLGVVATLVLLVVGLAGRRFRRPPKSALWWGLLGAWGVVTVLWAADPQVAIRDLPAALSLVILYLVTVSLRIEKKELNWIFASAILGGCIAAAIGSYQFYHGVAWGGDVSRGSLVMGAEAADPNTFAATLLLPFSLAMGYFLAARDWTKKVVTASAGAILVFGILVSMSRGAFLAVLAIAVVYFYRFNLRRRRMLGILAFSFLPLLVIPHSFFTRFQDTSGAGRVDVWQAGLMSLKTYGIWGAGFDNFASVYSNVAGYAGRFMGYTRDSHNTYLEIGVDLGILGLGFFFAAVTSQLRAVGSRAKALQACIPVMACEAACWAAMVSALFGNLIWRKFFWLPWMLLAVSVRLRNEEQAAVEFQTPA